MNLAIVFVCLCVCVFVCLWMSLWWTLQGRRSDAPFQPVGAMYDHAITSHITIKLTITHHQHQHHHHHHASTSHTSPFFHQLEITQTSHTQHTQHTPHTPHATQHINTSPTWQEQILSSSFVWSCVIVCGMMYFMWCSVSLCICGVLCHCNDWCLCHYYVWCEMSLSLCIIYVCEW